MRMAAESRAIPMIGRRWFSRQPTKHHRLRTQPSTSGHDGESHLDLHQIDRDIFVAKSQSLWVPPGGRAVFGGQVVGQALHAATLTVGEERQCHSLKSYFLLPARKGLDIVYKITLRSDRKSFTSRTVEAIQDGAIIFNADFSFCRADEPSPLAHQQPMPDVPPPESLRSHAEALEELLPTLPASMHPAILQLRQIPVEMRFCEPPDLLDPNPPPRPPIQHMWLRITQPLDDAPSVHRAAIAYASDHALLSTALRPHGINFPSPRLGAVASLDHSMWFHTPSFRADDWILYAMHSNWAGHGRGLSFGQLYDRKTGTLHVTCAQEAVMRLARPPPVAS